MIEWQYSIHDVWSGQASSGWRRNYGSFCIEKVRPQLTRSARNAELTRLERLKWCWMDNKRQHHKRIIFFTPQLLNFRNKKQPYIEYLDSQVRYKTRSLEYLRNVTLSKTTASLRYDGKCFRTHTRDKWIQFLIQMQIKDAKIKSQQVLQRVKSYSDAKSQRHGCAIFRQWQLRDFISNPPPPVPRRTLRNEAVFVALLIPKSAS